MDSGLRACARNRNDGGEIEASARVIDRNTPRQLVKIVAGVARKPQATAICAAACNRELIVTDPAASVATGA
jgi:hypothetical protein